MLEQEAVGGFVDALEADRVLHPLDRLAVDYRTTVCRGGEDHDAHSQRGGDNGVVITVGGNVIVKERPAEDEQRVWRSQLDEGIGIAIDVMLLELISTSWPNGQLVP